MKNFVLLLVALALIGCGSPAPAAVLIQNANGTLTANPAVLTLAQASTSTACAGKKIVFTTDQTLTANLVWPADRELIPENGAVVNHGAYTISYAGSTARWPLARIFNGTGAVTFGVNTPWEYPEWRGAVADAATNGTGTDSTAALQASFNSPTPTKLSGYYLFSNLTLPGLKTVVGDGIHVTGLIAKTGSTGIALTEQASAAKITLKDFSIYGREQAYTGGLRLGYTTGGNGVFGTEGLIDNIWVRDFPAGFPGIDINANVGQFGRLMAQSTGGIQIKGTGNMVGHVESMQSKGFTVTRYDTTTLQAACNFQDTTVAALEVEATDADVVPVYFSGNTQISSLWIGPTEGATYPHLIEMDPSSTTWAINNFKLYFHTGTAPTITNGNFKSGTLYFGGNATGKNSSGEGNYASSMWLSGRDFAINNQQFQSFILRVQNDGGTIKHRIAGSAGVASNYAGKITGAAIALTATTLGTVADAGTAESVFAAGAKISSVSQSVLMLDTASQVNGDFASTATIVYNNTGAHYRVNPYTGSSTVGPGAGVAANRFNFQLLDALTGLGVNWETALATPGKFVDIQYIGFLR